MNDSSLIENGRIDSADIVFDRGFILSAWVHLSFDGSGQGFGGYSLGGKRGSSSVVEQHEKQPNIAAEFIAGIMAVADVEKWSDLAGKIVRVKRDRPGFGGTIIALGHPVKDLWFDPSAAPAFSVFKNSEETTS